MSPLSSTEDNVNAVFIKFYCLFKRSELREKCSSSGGAMPFLHGFRRIIYEYQPLVDAIMCVVGMEEGDLGDRWLLKIICFYGRYQITPLIVWLERRILEETVQLLFRGCEVLRSSLGFALPWWRSWSESPILKYFWRASATLSLRCPSEVSFMQQKFFYVMEPIWTLKVMRCCLWKTRFYMRDISKISQWVRESVKRDWAVILLILDSLHLI